MRATILADRKHRNRLSAAAHRQRKESLIAELESMVKQNSFAVFKFNLYKLFSQVQDLRQENAALKEALEYHLAAFKGRCVQDMQPTIQNNSPSIPAVYVPLSRVFLKTPQ